MVTRREIEAVIGPVQMLEPVAEGRSCLAWTARPALQSEDSADFGRDAGKLPSSGRGICLQMPDDPREYAAVLYERLHEADRPRLGLDRHRTAAAARKNGRRFAIAWREPRRR